ncbi:hypothetical protein DFH06DRAFT_507191 [Mycena polygramma]|nr:hypothetical protein DFH06DRAFT_507191 [Mycena polygramma]
MFGPRHPPAPPVGHIDPIHHLVFRLAFYSRIPGSILVVSRLFKFTSSRQATRVSDRNRKGETCKACVCNTNEAARIDTILATATSTFRHQFLPRSKSGAPSRVNPRWLLSAASTTRKQGVKLLTRRVMPTDSCPVETKEPRKSHSKLRKSIPGSSDGEAGVQDFLRSSRLVRVTNRPTLVTKFKPSIRPMTHSATDVYLSRVLSQDYILLSFKPHALVLLVNRTKDIPVRTAYSSGCLRLFRMTNRHLHLMHVAQAPRLVEKNQANPAFNFKASLIHWLFYWSTHWRLPRSL